MNKALKYFSSLAVISLIAFASSCSGQKSDERQDGSVDDPVKAELEKYLSSLSAADTAEVREISERFLSDLQENRFDEAVSTLYQLDEAGTLEKVDSATIASLRKRNLIFPVVNYTFDGVRFLSPANNAVKYVVEFDKGNPPATTKWAFNPVKYEDKWYLTLLN